MKAVQVQTIYNNKYKQNNPGTANKIEFMYNRPCAPNVEHNQQQQNRQCTAKWDEKCLELISIDTKDNAVKEINDELKHAAIIGETSKSRHHSRHSRSNNKESNNKEHEQINHLHHQDEKSHHSKTSYFSRVSRLSHLSRLSHNSRHSRSSRKKHHRSHTADRHHSRRNRHSHKPRKRTREHHKDKKYRHKYI